MPSFAEVAQFPLNAIGNRGEGAFLGMERMFFQGQTGLISTMMGIPGVSGTRLSTGVYQIAHPPCVACDILPTVQAPSGMFFQSNIAKHSAKSGIAELHFFNEAYNTGPASGYAQFINPPTGTQVKLQFFVSPYNEF